MALLSKSDFKVASDCITTLYYKKTGYPSTNDENDYQNRWTKAIRQEG
jgi:hypothetical protein